jgi:hypothetical protein
MCLPQGTIIGFTVVNASPEHLANGRINNNNIKNKKNTIVIGYSVIV